MMGITPDDRVANAFDFSIWIPGLITHYGMMAAGNFCLAFGKVYPVEVYRRLDMHGFHRRVGRAHVAHPPDRTRRERWRPETQAPYRRREEIARSRHPLDARGLGRRGGSACATAPSSRATGIGFQPCLQADGYHVNTHDFYPELIEPDADGWGELVFTTLRRDVMPLIRYRTRDVHASRRPSAPAALRAPRISKLRGRRDELVVASGGNLYPLMFENIVNRPSPADA